MAFSERFLGAIVLIARENLRLDISHQFCHEVLQIGGWQGMWGSRVEPSAIHRPSCADIPGTGENSGLG